MKKIRCSAKLMNKSLMPAKKKVQAADFDAEAFRQRHKDAAERRKAKKDKKPELIITQIQRSEDPMEEAFELLVPASGKADTVAGELIRAIMRLLYRDYNDGDVFYEGYGIETCGDAVAFLCDKLPELEDMFDDIARRDLRDDQYTEGLKEIGDEVLEYIYRTPDLITTENKEDMFDFNGEKFIEDHEWEPVYEFSCDIPENVRRHFEAGNIGPQDLEWEIQDWEGMGDADIRVDSNGEWVDIQDLKKDAYDLCEEQFESWLEDYGDQLDEEYELPDEEDEEYEEEE